MEKYEVNFSIYTIFYKSCLGERWECGFEGKKIAKSYGCDTA
jgi:hypothetical protein